ncbi:hypothetical protein [Acinetobacter venetianus]|uniref:Uncharacterized protein n=1 Tax=Acinetobacter venetianus TaxID=52133 RepID=A0A150HZ57_9GAMM|nr:hypothetical protein [Acinetobacter venetianus]KXZ72510.1 hypothetical protein AVENLUH13518_00503 [Acinetobacter venetianus]
MYHSAYATISQLKQLCPLHSSIATCLNQLRCANIQFLNLGSLIVCPQQRCALFFYQRHLMEIQAFTI